MLVPLLLEAHKEVFDLRRSKAGAFLPRCALYSANRAYHVTKWLFIDHGDITFCTAKAQRRLRRYAKIMPVGFTLNAK